MTDALLVDECHSHEDLLHKVLDRVHRDQLLLVFGCLNDLLQVLMTELEDQVLHNFALIVLRVVDVEQLHNVFAASQTV